MKDHAIRKAKKNKSLKKCNDKAANHAVVNKKSASDLDIKAPQIINESEVVYDSSSSSDSSFESDDQVDELPNQQKEEHNH